MEGGFCLSFDLVSLFTNVHLNETIEMTVNKVPENEIPQRNTKNLLKSVTGGVFQHGGKLYTQIDRVNIGNPLAPTLGNDLMGTIENYLGSFNFFFKVCTCKPSCA